MALLTHTLKMERDEDDLISFTNQLPPLDLSESWYVPPEWHYELPQTDYIISGNGLGNGLFAASESYNDQQQVSLIFNDDEDIDAVKHDSREESKVISTPRTCYNKEEESSSRPRIMLSKETISKYFYMPLEKAAKEMNVGTTLLKTRCRELGFSRWPYRKLISLQNLIKNIQASGKEHEYSVESLEREMKLIEEDPDRELSDDTKRLRQIFFKKTHEMKEHVCLR